MPLVSVTFDTDSRVLTAGTYSVTFPPTGTVLATFLDKISVSAAGISFGAELIVFTGLPTTDPVYQGQMWLDGTALRISEG